MLLEKPQRGDIIVIKHYEKNLNPEGMSLLPLQDNNSTLSGFKNTLCLQSYNHFIPSGLTICSINN
jgi:hypothetical protein